MWLSSQLTRTGPTLTRIGSTLTRTGGWPTTPRSHSLIIAGVALRQRRRRYEPVQKRRRARKRGDDTTPGPVGRAVSAPLAAPTQLLLPAENTKVKMSRIYKQCAAKCVPPQSGIFYLFSTKIMFVIFEYQLNYNSFSIPSPHYKTRCCEVIDLDKNAFIWHCYRFSNWYYSTNDCDL